MKKICNFFLLSLFFVCTHLSATPSPLNFSELPTHIDKIEDLPLWNLHGKDVLIRGFWYPLSRDMGILSSQTNLKNCCLKIHTKVHQQIFVKGDISSFCSQKALTIEGIFTIEPIYNSEGHLVQLFVLNQAKEIRPLSLSIPKFIGSFITLCCVVFFICSRFVKGKR